MDLIQESAEHHLLTYIDKIKSNPQGWVSVCAHYSGKIDHSELIANPSDIKQFFEKITEDSRKIATAASQMLSSVNDCVIYQFKDGDVFILARPSSPAEQQLVKDVHKKLENIDESVSCSYKPLAGDMYNVQKMIDGRLLSAKRVEAYLAISDINKCSTIGIRRERREESMVLIVEDDQFTGTYATNIVNKETASTLVKNGEEAIIKYIEEAPDIVFLDIHLPGICGQKTLDAIMHIDPEAHVIMLSVDAKKNSIVDAYDKGAAGFLKKPFSKERLLFTVGKSPYIRRPLITDEHAARLSQDSDSNKTIN